MRAFRTVGLLLAAAGLLAACDGQSETGPEGSGATSDASASCVSASVGGTSVHLSVPPGFERTTDSEAADLLDQVWFRRNDDGYADLVTLHGFDPDRYGADKPDSFVLLRALQLASAGGVSDSGTPGYREAVSEVEQQRRAEVTYSAPNRVGEGSHSTYGALETVEDDRYTVTLVAPTGDAFASLRDAVLPTVEEGGCPE